MKNTCFLFLTILLSLTFTFFSTAQDSEGRLLQNVSVKPGLGFEYFSRTISWDEDQYDSKLKSYLFTFNTEVEIIEGFYLSAIFGYSLSNYDALAFRELPFSIELEVGSIGGFILGGEIKKSILHLDDFEIDGLGQFIYYLGKKQEWEIPGLLVKGTVKGKPSWMRATIGPYFSYKGIDYFYPYLHVSFNRLWGKFKMDQTIQELTGSEDKKIRGKGSFCTSLGVIYELTDAFHVKGEVNVLPSKDNVDLGFMIMVMYSL